MPAKKHDQRPPRDLWYRYVMLLRAHRQVVRTCLSGLALSCLVVFGLLGFSRFWQAAPPPAAVGFAPVIVGDVPFWLLVILGGVFAACVILRSLVTDASLEIARKRAGDDTVISASKSSLFEPGGQSPFDEDLAKTALAANPEMMAFLDHSHRALSLSAYAQLEDLIENVQLDTPLGVVHASRWNLFRRKKAEQPPVLVENVGDALSSVINAVVAPDTIFTRVSERRELGDERATVTVARTVEGHPALRHLVLIPILRIPKAKLVGALSVQIDGKPARTVPTSMSRGLLVRMLQQLVVQAANDASDEQKQLLLQFAARAGQAIVSDVPLEERIRGQWLAVCDDVLRSLAPQPAEPWLVALAEIALSSDIIFAVVPEGCGSTRRISVSYTEPYGERVIGVVNHIRRLVGIGPAEYKIDLHRIAEANSYHLDVTTVANTYVEEASVIVPGARAERDRAAVEPSSELIQVASLRGDGQTHLYWRNYRRDGITGGSARSTTPQFYLRIRERPPGLLGPTLALSAWTTTLTCAVGYFYPLLFANTSGGSSVWTTVILAAPALLAGWLLSRLTVDSLRIMSASTFMLVATLALIVALLVTMSAFTMSGVSLPTWELSAQLLVYHPDWMLLMAMTMLHALATGLLFIGRGRRYRSTINERAGE
ncbi:hypothetical protein DC31_02160 [Microbacterium sp. CH12i]|uniref:hypothetical protein n=1 Tax=Microbacterium sp. CH12i TaxID=1479651 RepID=UPI0004613ADE|nr:hypothetical protein [Microbacterium sp. CH12i]KDA05221.1 hypothetical protein DC31_02160 [Microbacterium sp. CH12i]